MKIPHEFYFQHQQEFNWPDGNQDYQQNFPKTDPLKNQLSIGTAAGQIDHPMMRFPSGTPKDEIDSASVYSDSGSNLEGPRKRSSESLNALILESRKRSVSLSSPMRKLNVATAEEEMDKTQLLALVKKLRVEKQELITQYHLLEDHLLARDQRIAHCQKELEEKNIIIGRMGQFKEILVRYLDYFPDNRHEMQ